MFLFMRLCNKAQLCSVKFVNSLLIMNNDTVLLTSSAGEAVTFEQSSGSSGRKKRSTDSNFRIDFPAGNVKRFNFTMLCYVLNSYDTQHNLLELFTYWYCSLMLDSKFRTHCKVPIIS